MFVKKECNHIFQKTYRDSNLQSDVMQTKELFSNDTAKPSLNRMISMQNINAKKISALPNDKFTFKDTKCNENKTTVKQFLELRSISKCSICLTIQIC